MQRAATIVASAGGGRCFHCSAASPRGSTAAQVVFKDMDFKRTLCVSDEERRRILNQARPGYSGVLKDTQGYYRLLVGTPGYSAADSQPGPPSHTAARSPSAQSTTVCHSTKARRPQPLWPLTVAALLASKGSRG